MASRYGPQIDDMLARLATSSTVDGTDSSETSSFELDTVIHLHDQQDLELHSSIAMILQMSYHYKRITRHLDLPPNEAELRVGIDNLLNYIYDNVDGDTQIWHS